MDVIALRTTLILALLSAIFPHSFSRTTEIIDTNKPNAPPTPPQSSGATFIFPIHGNVYPLGHYTVKLSIGNPPQLFDLDIDSGSDLTWVQCASCKTGCAKPGNQVYQLIASKVVKCGDSSCSLVSKPSCSPKTASCQYKVVYEDNGSSQGVLVQDFVSFKFSNKNPSFAHPRLAFGCGLNQQIPRHASFLPATAGVLGLGNGEASIVSQLKASGLIRNVVGHCLSSNGGGYMFLGDGSVKTQNLVWTPISASSSSLEHYRSGPADVLFNGNPNPVVKDLNLIFDSGSTYTYLYSLAYKAVFDRITGDLKGQLNIDKDDTTLSICWKGPKKFDSALLKRYFKTLTLSFTKSKNTQLQLPPEAYLIVSGRGNACLGILNGTEVGLGGNDNIIGDISLQDKLVVYDNENKRIGWSSLSVNCGPPKP